MSVYIIRHVPKSQKDAAWRNPPFCLIQAHPWHSRSRVVNENTGGMLRVLPASLRNRRDYWPEGMGPQYESSWTSCSQKRRFGKLEGGVGKLTV